MLYAVDGSTNVVVVPGTSYVGAQSPSGAMNIVQVNELRIQVLVILVVQ